MRRLGEVARLAAGRIIVRSVDAEHPDVGSEAVNADLEPVGRVVDVFGPVDRPYVTLTPTEEAGPSLLGQRLYVR